MKAAEGKTVFSELDQSMLRVEFLMPQSTAHGPYDIRARMIETKATQRSVPWLALLGLGGFWLIVVRMLSPQWSVYAQYNYGWAVPFLCAYLLWQRWPNRPAPAPAHVVQALLVFTLCAFLLLPTRVIVEANPIWRAGSWAMALELVGLSLCIVYLVGGKSWLKHFGFPIFFFLIAIPWPSQWEGAVVQTLMRVNTTIVVEILTALGVPAVARGNVIEISTGLVGIDEACSGIRSLQATLMIALFFGELNRLRVARRTGLVLVGVALALVCNMARTFVLVWVCSKSGLGALDQWHDPTGIAILLVCFGGLWAVAHKLRPPASPAAPQIVTSSPWPRPLPQLIPAAVLIWLVLVEGGTAAWFGVHEKADPRILNWSVRWPTDKPDLRQVELSRRVILEMKFKEGKSMSWRESDGIAWQAFYFRWGPATSLLERVRVQLAKTHRPEICLPAAGLTLRADRGIKDFGVGGLTLPFRAYYFEDRGLPVHVYFCAWEDGTQGIAANMRENPATRLAAARAGSRSISQRVLEIAVWGCRDSQQADAALHRELTELIQH